MEGLQPGSRKTLQEALPTCSSHSWLQAGPSQLHDYLPWLQKHCFPGDFHCPTSISTCSVREALILTQLAGWHPLPVLQTSAAFPGCYLTPLSASGIQEHIRLLGKMIFCKSKCTRPELMVTLEAMCAVKPWTSLMASDTQEPGTSSAVKMTSPLTGSSELVTQIVRGGRTG